MQVGIAGGGLAGRLLAIELLTRDPEIKIHLFDQDTIHGKSSCGYTAAGLLAPLAELEQAESEIYKIGQESIKIWPEIIKKLNSSIYFQNSGSLIVSHPQDSSELNYFYKVLESKINNKIKLLDKNNLIDLEPELNAKFNQGLYLSEQGQICPQDFFKYSTEYLKNKISWYPNSMVAKTHPNKIILDNKTEYNFDWVFDARGLGAKNQIKNLRGVRGELLVLHAPEVNISRPVRLLHPRHAIYLAPRPNHIYILGASQIESESMAPITVQSTMELLSSAYSLHSGFAEANILESRVNCRPAIDDNLPIVKNQSGLSEINGLYRHGWLLGPKLVKDCVCTVLN